MKQLQWKRVVAAGILLAALVGLGIYALPDHAGSIRTKVVVEAEGDTTDIGAVVPSTLTLSRSSMTLAAVLEEHGISHGPNEVADVFNGQVAVQTEEEWAFVRQHWNVTVVDRNVTVPLTALDDLVVRDGNRILFTYHRRVTGTAPLPDTPGFVTVVSWDAARNGQGRTDYLSCINNRALHDWEERYRQGDTAIPDYPFNPPVCGAHLHRFPPTGEHDIPHNPDVYIQTKPLTPVPMQLHILGHGMTIVQYQPDKVGADTVQQLAE